MSGTQRAEIIDTPKLSHLESDGTLSNGGLVESLSAGGELLRSGLLGFSLGLQSLASDLLGLTGLLLLAGLDGSLIRVEGDLDGGDLEGVSLLGKGNLDRGHRAQHGLDLIGVDDTGQVSVGHERTRQVEAVLEFGALLVCAEDRVQLLEGTLGPDDESAQVATRSQVQERQVINQSKLNTRKVSESLVKTLGHVIDDERTSSLCVSSVSGFADTTADLLGVSCLLNIIHSTDLGQSSLGVFGLGDAVQGVRHNQRKFRDVFDAVATGHNEGRKSRGSQSR